MLAFCSSLKGCRLAVHLRSGGFGSACDLPTGKRRRARTASLMTQKSEKFRLFFNIIFKELRRYYFPSHFCLLEDDLFCKDFNDRRVENGAIKYQRDKSLV